MPSCSSPGGLGGEHRRAVVAQKRAREPAFQECLGEPVHEALGRLVEVPLEMADEAGVIVEEADQPWSRPLSARREHFARAVVEVGVPEGMGVRDLEAAHLAVVEALHGVVLRGRIVGGDPAPAEKVVGFGIPANRGVGRQGTDLRFRRHPGREVVVVQAEAPALVRGVLIEENPARLLTQRRLSARVAPPLATQGPDRIGLGGAGRVVPPFDGGEAEPGGLARDRMEPALAGQLLDLCAQFPRGRRRGQQRSDHREPQVGPAFVGGRSILIRHRVRSLLAAATGRRKDRNEPYPAPGARTACILCVPPAAIKKPAVLRAMSRSTARGTRAEP